MGVSLLWLATRAAASCPCTYDGAIQEVTCEPNTVQLPFYLPNCISVDATEVHRLVLTEQSFSQLLIGSFFNFPSLRYLDLSKSNIDVIDDFALDANLELTDLILTRNNLVNIPDLFQSSINSLQSLTVRHNQLQSVNGQFLDNLIILDLEDNLLTEKDISIMLSSMVNLYDVNLDSNSIEKITSTTFGNQIELRQLSLYGNEISYLETGSFDHLTKLQFANLKKNPTHDYTTEGWHFCHGLEAGNIEISLDEDGSIVQDLKVDAHTDAYCESALTTSQRNIQQSCTDDDGHLTCSGNIGDLICELKEAAFKSVTFIFPKDDVTHEVDDFFEAETNSYFKDFNNVEGQSNVTKYLKDLKLYGTKFDLAVLDSHIGLRTEKVTVFADTVYMSRPLHTPISSKLVIRARVVSISEDIAMNMTYAQFFKQLPADQPVDNWASVEEIIVDVGNTSFAVRKHGLVEVLQTTHLTIANPDQSKCSPRLFTVELYATEHNTSPSVFFDRVQMTLLRVAVRTLASTRSNDRLAVDMVDHTLSKTTTSSIVADKKAYVIAQKLIHDKEILMSHSRNVPFYSTSVMIDLARIMHDSMTTYYAIESELSLKIYGALGRMGDMNMHFEMARQQREMYFETEWEILSQIFTFMEEDWIWSFNASRKHEGEIQDALAENGEQMFQMQENELKDLLERAKATVESDQAVVDKFEAEIERYAQQATHSKDLQRSKIRDANAAGIRVEDEQEKFEEAMHKWIWEQIMKLIFGFLEALLGMIGGLMSFDWTLGANAVEEGEEIAGATGNIKDIFKRIVDILKLLQQVEEMLQCIFNAENTDKPCEWDFTTPGWAQTDSTKPSKTKTTTTTTSTTTTDNVINSDVTLDNALFAAMYYRQALEASYKLKNLTSAYAEMRTFGDIQLASIGPMTDNELNPNDLQQAIATYANLGEEIVQETINFAELMRKLADLGNELDVAKLDLELAVKDVVRITDSLVLLKYQHKFYVANMNKHRDDYEDECDDFADKYKNATDAMKEEFKQRITELFDKFKDKFDESSNEYVDSMNDMTAALYSKVASLKQHSMTQRAMIMNLYQDFCDGLFYHNFGNCDDTAVPSMSDEFTVLLDKLITLEWDGIQETPVASFNFDNVLIELKDSKTSGFNDTLSHGPVSAFKETHKMMFNIKDYTNYFNLTKHYRIRISKIRINLMGLDDTVISTPSPAADDAFMFDVSFPLEFFDTDIHNNTYSFRGMNVKKCPADYYTEGGNVVTISECRQDDEFEGVNHKTSHNGVITVTTTNIDQSIRDKVEKIRVFVDGTYMER